MFQHVYQGGPFVEIFAPQSKILLSNWKIPSCAKKAYDHEAKTFVYCLQGTSCASRMQIPRDIKKSLGLTQPYLVLQVYVPRQGEFSLEVGAICCSRNRRRILFSGVQKSLHVTTLLTTVPLTLKGKDMWVNLCIDFIDLISGFWKGESYRSLDSVTVTGTCRLKRIFTLNDNVVYSNNPNFLCVSSNRLQQREIVIKKEFKKDSQLFLNNLAIWERLFLNALPKQCQLPNFLHQTVQYLSTASLDYENNFSSKAHAEEEYDCYAFGDKNQHKYPSLTDRFISAMDAKGVKQSQLRRRSCGDVLLPKKHHDYSSKHETKKREKISEKKIIIKTRVEENEHKVSCMKNQSKIHEENSRYDDLTSKTKTGTSINKGFYFSEADKSKAEQSKVSGVKNIGFNTSNLLLVGSKMTPVEVSENEMKQINQPKDAVHFFPPAAQSIEDAVCLHSFETSNINDYVVELNESDFNISENNLDISIPNINCTKFIEISDDAMSNASNNEINYLSEDFSNTTDKNTENSSDVKKFLNEETNHVDHTDFILKGTMNSTHCVGPILANSTQVKLENINKINKTKYSSNAETSVFVDCGEKSKCDDFIKSFGCQVDQFANSSGVKEEIKSPKSYGKNDTCDVSVFTSHYDFELPENTSFIDINNKILGVGNLENVGEIKNIFGNIAFKTHDFDYNDITDSRNDEIATAISSIDDIESLNIKCEISEQKYSPYGQEGNIQDFDTIPGSTDAINSYKNWLRRNFLNGECKESE